MKKVILFSALLIIITLLGSCNNPERQSFDSIKNRAESGDSLAQYNLASMYYTGNGIKPDTTQAFYWYQKSAEQGYANAQLIIGSRKVWKKKMQKHNTTSPLCIILLKEL